jgi:hypothetical protein
MPSGGFRIGAGRKPKALAEKLFDGNPGKREIRVNKFNPENGIESGQEYEENIPEYIDIATKEGGNMIPGSTEIYIYLLDYIKKSGCRNLIADFLIEDFAVLRRSYLECEYMNKTLGRIYSKKRSPYVDMAIAYHKEMMAVYSQIWNIISRNSERRYESQNEFFEFLTDGGF